MSSSANTISSKVKSASAKNQSGVQSLEIGLSVLEVLVENNQPMMLKDVAQVLQMHPAKTHRYLVSLIRKDYARQFDDGRYGLGNKANALGMHGSFGYNNNILERLNIAATAIKDTLNCGVQIAKWFSEGPIIIASAEPDSPISIITRIGSRMPLTTSATGQLFASYQSKTAIRPLVLAEWQSKSDALLSAKKGNLNGNSRDDEETSEPNHQERLAKQWLDFTQRQVIIRTQGYATVNGDMLMGINAISIPVLPPATSVKSVELTVEYAITVIGTSQQLPTNEQHRVAAKIKAIAQRYQLA